MSESDIASDMQSLLSVHSLHPEPSDMTSASPRRPSTCLSSVRPLGTDLRCPAARALSQSSSAGCEP